MSSFLTSVFASVGKVLGVANKLDSELQSVEGVAEAALGTTAASIAQYEAGQAVILGPISESGHAGHVVAVMVGGDASKALGLG